MRLLLSYAKDDIYSKDASPLEHAKETLVLQTRLLWSLQGRCVLRTHISFGLQSKHSMKQFGNTAKTCLYSFQQRRRKFPHIQLHVIRDAILETRTLNPFLGSDLGFLRSEYDGFIFRLLFFSLCVLIRTGSVLQFIVSPSLFKSPSLVPSTIPHDHTLIPINRSHEVLFSAVSIAYDISLCFARKPPWEAARLLRVQSCVY